MTIQSFRKLKNGLSELLFSPTGDVECSLVGKSKNRKLLDTPPPGEEVKDTFLQKH